MKEENYKQEHLEEVFELKRQALLLLDHIEKAIWTDEMDEATSKAARLYDALQKVRAMKNVKAHERKMEFLKAELAKQGIQVSVINIKKVD